MKSKIYLLFSIIFAFVACEQDTIGTFGNKTAVVQAYIFAGQPIDSIRVTQAYAYSETDTTLTTLDDLLINLSGPEGETGLISIGEGYYQRPDYIVQAGNSYFLEFEFNGETISAETYIPEKTAVTISAEVLEMEKIEFGGGGFGGPGGGFTQIDPIELRWDNAEGDHFYVVIDNLEETPEYINSLFENPDLPLRRFNLRTEPEITDFYRIDPRRQLQQFGRTPNCCLPGQSGICGAL
jgi:hypothetical protein